MSLPYGKLDPDRLRTLLPPAGRDVLIGPGIGLDAAVLELSDPADDVTGSHAPAGPHAHDDAPPGLRLVAASDPITFAADQIGWYAVHVNANDIACMGATPRWFLATLLLPATLPEPEIAATFDQLDRALRELDRMVQSVGRGHGPSLVGGHTEVTPGLDRIIVCGTMLGLARRTVSAAGGRPGDALLLTKGVAVEGTAILAREASERLAGRVDGALLERARRFLHDPGLSVVPDALVALDAGGSAVHALHDPTEGGLCGGVRELCEASVTGARIAAAALPLLPETRALCEPLDIDPLGLIASGALLIAVAPGRAAVVMDALAASGIACARIGTLEQPEAGLRLEAPDGSTAPLPGFDGDEIRKIF